MSRASSRRGWRSGSYDDLVSGDSPQEAVTAFLEPFRAVLGVLDGKGDIVIPRRGSLITSKGYSWVLNPERGMKLGYVGTLYASMRFEVLDYGRGPKEFGKRFRVTILGYNYREANSQAS
jgi:hypothetical protein